MVFFEADKGRLEYDLFACDWDARQHVKDCDNITSAHGYIFKIHRVSPYPTLEHTPSMEELIVEIQIGK